MKVFMARAMRKPQAPACESGESFKVKAIGKPASPACKYDESLKGRSCKNALCADVQVW